MTTSKEKTDKTDKVIDKKSLSNGIEKTVNKTKPKNGKKPTKRFTRDMAVNQVIKKSGKNGFTFQQLLDKSDKIMVSKGFNSNPTAFNVNKYILTGLIAFGIVKPKTSKIADFKISVKNTEKMIYVK